MKENSKKRKLEPPERKEKKELQAQEKKIRLMKTKEYEKKTEEGLG